MNALGVQRDLPEDGLWEIGHIDVALGLLWARAGGGVLVPPCRSLV